MTAKFSIPVAFDKVITQLLQKFPVINTAHLQRIFILYTIFIVGLIVLPLLYLIPVSLNPAGLNTIPTTISFRWYSAVPQNAVLINSFVVSIQLAVVTTIITTPLAFLAARATFSVSRLRPFLVGFFILPLFVPGSSTGIAIAVYFQILGINPGFIPVLITHIIWTFPFAFIILLTTMTTFDRTLREAAFDLGASPLRTFLDIEYPEIKPGLLGAAIFSFTISFNELGRTTFVRGAMNTMPTYVWARVSDVGLHPTHYAVASITVIISIIALVLILLVVWNSMD